MIRGSTDASFIAANTTISYETSARISEWTTRSVLLGPAHGNRDGTVPQLAHVAGVIRIAWTTLLAKGLDPSAGPRRQSCFDQEDFLYQLRSWLLDEFAESPQEKVGHL